MTIIIWWSFWIVRKKLQFQREKTQSAQREQGKDRKKWFVAVGGHNFSYKSPQNLASKRRDSRKTLGAVIKYTLNHVLWHIRKMTVCLFISPCTYRNTHSNAHVNPFLVFRFRENWIRLIDRENVCLFISIGKNCLLRFIVWNNFECYLLFWIYPTECKTDDKLWLHTRSSNSQHRPPHKVTHHCDFSISFALCELFFSIFLFSSSFFVSFQTKAHCFSLQYTFRCSLFLFTEKTKTSEWWTSTIATCKCN